MSNTRKINLIIKKWILKGIWLLDIGSNPHSKGEDFSRSIIIFFEINKLINIIIIEININNKIIIVNWIIINTN